MGAYIDSLTPDQKLFVTRKARGDKRPSYFNAQVAGAQSSAASTGLSSTSSLDPHVQISEDLEAALILMPTVLKTSLLSFLQSIASIVGSTDDLDLMNEIVSARALTIRQVVTDVSAPISSYDATRQAVMSFITKAQTITASPGQAQPVGQKQTAADVIIPDLALLFALGSAGHNQVATADIVDVHNRIADVGVLGMYSSEGLYRIQETTSWIGVITTYLS